MKVSIIIPVFNVSAYLPRCLDSVITQSYDDLEIILVDDGSIDSSGCICDEYARKDERIVVLHQKNLGVSAARNAGIARSSGEYIQFVDADDYVEPTYTEILLTSILETGADLSVCNYNQITLKNDVMVDKRPYLLTTGIKYRDDYWLVPINSSDFTKICTRHEASCVWGKMYRSSIIKGHNVRFDERLYFAEDFLFSITYNQYINYSFTIAEAVYNHFIYTNSNRQSLTTRTYSKEFELQNYLKSQLYDIYTRIDASEEAYRCLNDYCGSMRIGHFIRMCNKINKYSAIEIYRLYKGINKQHFMNDFLRRYVPLKGRSKVVPILLKNGLIFSAIMAAKIHLWLDGKETRF